MIGRIAKSLEEIAERLKLGPESPMGDMIALITVCVTLLLGVLGFIFNSLIQRRNNSIKVITEDRVARRKATQDVLEKFLPCADIMYLRRVSSDTEKKKVMEICTECVVTLRSLYTFTAEYDRELVFAAMKVKEEIHRILYGGEMSGAKLKNATKVFLRKADLHMTTEWKRIKKEANGKYKNGNGGYKAWVRTWKKHEKVYKEKPEEKTLVNDKRKYQDKKKKKHS